MGVAEVSSLVLVDQCQHSTSAYHGHGDVWTFPQWGTQKRQPWSWGCVDIPSMRDSKATTMVMGMCGHSLNEGLKSDNHGHGDVWTFPQWGTQKQQPWSWGCVDIPSMRDSKAATWTLQVKPCSALYGIPSEFNYKWMKQACKKLYSDYNGIYIYIWR